MGLVGKKIKDESQTNIPVDRHRGFRWICGFVQDSFWDITPCAGSGVTNWRGERRSSSGGNALAVLQYQDAASQKRPRKG